MARSHKHRPAPHMVPGLGGYVARNVGKHTSYPMRAAGTSPARPRLRRRAPAHAGPRVRPPGHAREDTPGGYRAGSHASPHPPNHLSLQ